MSSEGYHFDPHAKLGRAVLKINGTKDYSINTRGFNIVVIDGKTGRLTQILSSLYVFMMDIVLVYLVSWDLISAINVIYLNSHVPYIDKVSKLYPA